MREKYDDVIVMSPVRDGRFHTAYVVGLMNSNGLHNGWCPYSGQSDIYIARNTILNTFYLNKQYKTLVCIDSDIGFSRAQLKALIDSEGDVVSGIYTDKQQPPMPFCRDENGNHVKHKDIPPEGMIRSLMIPGGFFKIEREAIDKIVAKNLCRQIQDDNGQDVYLFHETRIHKNKILSEDFSLGALLLEAGIQVYTNCGIRVTHDGRSWDGAILDEFQS